MVIFTVWQPGPKNSDFGFTPKTSCLVQRPETSRLMLLKVKTQSSLTSKTILRPSVPIMCKSPPYDGPVVPPPMLSVWVWLSRETPLAVTSPVTVTVPSITTLAALMVRVPPL